MTDITDQDRRNARQWAEGISGSRILNENARAAVRYVLATVDAPAPTLAEELANITEHWEEWTTDNITEELTAATTRAEQVERDRDEARAELERERDLGVALTHERDEARAEVERLTAVNEQLRRTDNFREFKEFLGVQKGAESNAETPHPADVEPGEAWLVEVQRKLWTGLKDYDDESPWTLARRDALLTCVHNCEIDRLVSRLVPAPRVITNPDDIDRAKRRTVIRDAAGVVCSRDGMGDAWTTFTSLADQRPHIALPATVLWEPGE